jgi:hypothetical protein
MTAQFDHHGRVHMFRVSLAPRADGRIGPPLEVIVDGLDPRGRTIRCRKRERWRVAYEGVDPKRDRLIYCVVEVL